MTHTHSCALCYPRVRAWLVCTQEPDQCDIRHFVCPKCQDDQLHADIIQLEREASTRTDKEPTREHQQRIPE